ncbi:MAG: hypothetical protein HY851_08285 [candidate division Zixibacteria bacterium]|nr:hypothetical protein [candidate division Zixibacteria bacterium]
MAKPAHRTIDDSPVNQSSGYSRWTALGLAIALAVGLALRLYDLDADAPARFADASQDFTTDSGFLTLYAKNHALFGQWTLFGYEHWQAFKTSLITGVAFFLYSSFGLSLVTSALTGTLLSVLGLVITLAALARHLSPREILIIAVFLAFNFVLILYGHFPFSENALLFLISLFIGLFFWRSDSIAMSATLGLLIAVAAFFGKMFGVILLVGPVVWWLTEKTERRGTLIGTLIASTAAGLAVFSLVFHGRIEIISFVWAHGAEGHQFPHGLSSPIGFFENLMSYARTGLHEYTPFLSALAYLSLLWMIFFREQNPRVRKVSAFMASWMVAWIVVLSIFNYRPLRYQFLLIIPMTVLAAVWSLRAPDMIRRRQKVAWWQGLVLVLLNWYFIYHLVTPFTLTTLSLATYWRWVWLMLPVAVLVTATEIVLFSRKKLAVSRRLVTIIWAVALTLTIINDGRLYYHWISHRTYNISGANTDMADLLGPKAVISGQYGPAITQATPVKNFPLFITSPLGEGESLLRQYGVTHLALPSNLWRDLTKTDPRLTNIPIVARYWLRDNIVYVIPVWDLFEDSAAPRYQPTAYEKGVRAMFVVADTLPDVQLKAFLQTHPNNRSALIALHHWNAHTGNLAASAPLVARLLELYPTDFSIQLLAAIYYKKLSEISGDAGMRTKADQYLDRAVFYNPINSEILRTTFERSTPDMWEI